MSAVATADPALRKPHVFAGLLARGQAIDVTRLARHRLGERASLAIDVGTYDRFVSWDSRAMRNLAVSLDERDRLENLICACCSCPDQQEGLFTCRAVDARGDTPHARRFVLTVENYGSQADPLWLVR